MSDEYQLFIDRLSALLVAAPEGGVRPGITVREADFPNLMLEVHVDCFDDPVPFPEEHDGIEPGDPAAFGPSVSITPSGGSPPPSSPVFDEASESGASASGCAVLASCCVNSSSALKVRGGQVSLHACTHRITNARTQLGGTYSANITFAFVAVRLLRHRVA
jgi:hypothetical protein